MRIFIKNTENRAFTLVELSIVLVIIGLLTAGVVGGQSLIQSAKRNAIITEYNGYKVAINAFKLEYDALPGDMADATLYWGKNASACNGHTGTAVTDGKQTCNGNASGVIDNGTEAYQFWKHLSNAGIVNGTSTGLTGSGGVNHSIPGTNVPLSKFGDNVGITIYSINNGFAGDANWYPYDYGHLFMYGKPATNYLTYDPFMTPKDLKAIDLKVDDGIPTQGLIISWRYGTGTINPNCTTSATVASALYNLSNNTNLCSGIFRLGF